MRSQEFSGSLELANEVDLCVLPSKNPEGPQCVKWDERKETTRISALCRMLKRNKKTVAYDKSFCLPLTQICKMGTELARVPRSFL